MADLFRREDSHFLVFFDADKTIQLLPNQRIDFSDDDNVSVSFPTSTLKDDGTELIQDIPYAGKVFFSGSASKCRGLKTRVNEEASKSNDANFFQTLQQLALEVKSCGKRGASVKLKRAIEEESKDISKKKNKKKKTNEEKGDKAFETPLVRQLSKSSSAKSLKLKEMMAFAGVSTNTNKSDQEETGTSPRTDTHQTESNGNLQRDLPKSTTHVDVEILDKSASGRLRTSPRKQPKQSGHSSPKKITNPSPCILQPENSASGGLRTSPRKQPKQSGHSSPKKITNPSPCILQPENSASGGLRTSPRKQPKQSGHSSPKKITKPSPCILQPENSASGGLRTSPRKHPKQSGHSSPKKITKPSPCILQPENSASGGLRTSPRKQPKQSGHSSPKKITKLSPCILQPENSSPSEMSEPRHSPPKIPSTETPQTCLDSETTISSLVSSSLNLLNSADEDPVGVQFEKEPTDFPQHAYYTAEYGYNAHSSMDCVPAPPMQGLINYYQQLDHNAQATVFGFLNVLVTELQSITFPAQSSRSTTTTTTNDKSHQPPAVPQQQRSGESERKIPLLKDNQGTYDDILVNPSKLRQAESKALVAKSPAAYLLNKIVDLIFTEEELASSKGVRSLDAHKMEAVSEYMHAWTLKMNIENLNAKTQTSLIQNKIGNLRFHRKKKAGVLVFDK